MNDNEIIKALNGADGLGHISIYCADNNGEDVCSIKLVDIIDLINRQKAEIEQYKARISNDIEYIERIEVENRNQKAELERLERHTEMYHEVRAEAVKKFAERLKKDISFWSFDFTYYSDQLAACRRIDNLAKEMEAKT